MATGLDQKRKGACANGACTADPCDSIACNQPPKATCQDAGTNAGGEQACAILSTGHVNCWGLYFGDDSGVAALEGVTSLSAHSWYHVCAALATGEAYCWGYNDVGELGNGNTSFSTAPQHVLGLHNVVSVAVGGQNDFDTGHSCAITADQNVYCWGSNDKWQLGESANTRSSLPLKVAGIANVEQLSLGARHTCALSGGEVFCWGAGTNGQLGDGVSANSPTPQKVKGLSGVTQVSAADLHTCALAGGAVYCWGNHFYGVLGDGESDAGSSNVPVQVPGLTDVVEVAAGAEHTCARVASGDMYCWGHGDRGQIGNGKSDFATTPVKVVGLSSPANVAAGGYQTCAARADGAVVCWGAYDLLGGVPPSTVPVPVAGLTNVTRVAAGWTMRAPCCRQVRPPSAADLLPNFNECARACKTARRCGS